MKRLRLYFTAVVLALAACMTAPAGAQVLRDASFNSVGRINNNGIVRDNTARSLGVFDLDGTIRDKAGTKLGSISNLEIFDSTGERIGYINTDGTVRDGASNTLGHVNISDGKVTDASGQTLGFARGIRVDWIACYYFFNFFKQ